MENCGSRTSHLNLRCQYKYGGPPVKKQIPMDNSAVVEGAIDHGMHELLPDLAYQRLAIVNVMLVGPRNGQWVLIDSGMPGSAGVITKSAEGRFGAASRPQAIILTHGHFDHVGALEKIADRWDVPIYAHQAEIPFLNGTSAYPPPDPSVGGGLLARLSPLFPRGPYNFCQRLQLLPADGSIPSMPGWRWIHTPGHTPGHISLWRESDRTLIAGDAFITTRQESAYAAIMQKPEMHGPPKYFTPDWDSARTSVQRLAELEPQLVVTGHGPAMAGQQMRDALHLLARDFDQIAMPRKGKYVEHPQQYAQR
jgi:glyoxylase-like metal-dependent hydrolase (beta-lactamase superfamily II)